jgi:hypothetical protein
MGKQKPAATEDKLFIFKLKADRFSKLTVET